MSVADPMPGDTLAAADEFRGVEEVPDCDDDGMLVVGWMIAGGIMITSGVNPSASSSFSRSACICARAV